MKMEKKQNSELTRKYKSTFQIWCVDTQERRVDGDVKMWASGEETEDLI